jgi:hypothetical protein
LRRTMTRLPSIRRRKRPHSGRGQNWATFDRLGPGRASAAPAAGAVSARACGVGV